MPRRKRASKGKIRVTLQDVLCLRGMSRAELVNRYGSEETALAYWRAHRAFMLAHGHEERRLPWGWEEDDASA